jgi:hypothetical protein
MLASQPELFSEIWLAPGAAALPAVLSTVVDYEQEMDQ